MGGMDVIDRFKQDVAAAPRRGVRLVELSAATGITLGSLRNIYYGQSPNPGYDKVRALQSYYDVRRTAS
jgi:hypothetical protein